MQVVKKTFLSLILLLLTSIIILPIVFGEENSHDIVNNNSSIPTDYQFLSNKYTQQELDDRTAINEFIPTDGYNMLGTNNNSNLSLSINNSNLSIIVNDQNAGYYWSSIIYTNYLLEEDSNLHDEGDLGASNFLIGRMKSPVIISYFVGELRREEGLFDSAGSSFTKPEIINENNKIGFSSTLKFATSNISLKLIVYIDDSGLNVEIPFDSIVEHGQMKLANISVYQYFGATKRARIPGYTFVPDGIGALIRYDDTIKGIYNKRFFGNDLGLTQTKSNEQMLFANLYGVVHGVDQNGFINIIKNGSTYGNLIVNPSRTEDDFNKSYVLFEYRVLYTQYLNSRKTNSVRLVQEDMNKFDIKMNYQFLSSDNANYVGMANSYKKYLGLENNSNNLNDISLHLNVLAAENRPTLFGNKNFSMTKIEELESIINNLNGENIENIDVTYHGWYNDGFSNSRVRYQKVNRKIGSKKALTNLLNTTTANIYFNLDYNHSNTNLGGYSSKDVVQSINQELIIDENNQYILSNDFVLKNLEKDFAKLNKIGINNIGFNQISKELTSNFYQIGYTREEAVLDYQSMLEIASKNAVAKPFSFLWSADVIYDIALYSSNQAKFNDTVPFIPLVLSEKIVYGRSSNFFSNTSNEVLRMIDYNIYPSFYITYESSNLLLNTKSNNIYTSRFIDWQPTIIEQYNYINEALNNVIGSSVIKREILDIGLVKNSYSNGVDIYVNYSENNYVIDGITIKPVSYEVVV